MDPYKDLEYSKSIKTLSQLFRNNDNGNYCLEDSNDHDLNPEVSNAIVGTMFAIVSILTLIFIFKLCRNKDNSHAITNEQQSSKSEVDRVEETEEKEECEEEDKTLETNLSESSSESESGNYAMEDDINLYCYESDLSDLEQNK